MDRALDPLPTRTARQVLRVLVAEDNPALRLLSERMVTRLGHHVESVADGREAVDAATTGCFDVVLMDLRMPVMDGLEATRHIRSLGSAIAQPRIVAVTANEIGRCRPTCLAAGLDDCLGKPFTIQDLERVFRDPELPAEATPQRVRPTLTVRFARLDELGAEAKDEILQTLIERVPEDLRALDSALATNDRARLRFYAHRLKGAGLAVGATELSDACVRLETAVDRNVIHEAFVAAVRSAYDACVHDIELETHAASR
jgi:CheY-like chemotaxis protein